MGNQDEIHRTVERRTELLAELAAINKSLVSDAVARMAEYADLVAAYKKPSSARVAGAVLHATRCTDVAGARLRDAMGKSLLDPDVADESSVDAEPLPLLLYLGREPDASDARAIAGLALQPVFARGRWRPCTLYSGEAVPEQLAQFVRRYGGDCFVMQRLKRRTGRDGED